MTYTIDIDEKEIQRQIDEILNHVMHNQLLYRYSGVDGEIRQAVKDLVYSHKDEILERVVDRASRELVKKGLPMLLDRMDGKEQTDG